MRSMVVTLPVADLARATRFLTALGFAPDGAPGAGRTRLVARPGVVVVLDDGGGADGADAAGGIGGRVIASLAAESRLAVDCAFARALVAGGRPWCPLIDDGTTYACSVADPDGHVWEVAHAAPAAGRAA